jgi:membrane protease YdiL (CAAX protease family)
MQDSLWIGSRTKGLLCALYVGAYIAWGYGNKFLPRDDSAFSWGVELAINGAFLAVLIALHGTGALRFGDYGGGSSSAHGAEWVSDTVFCLVVFAIIVLVLHEPISRLLNGFGTATDVRNLAPTEIAPASTFSTIALAITLIIGSILEEVVYRGMLLYLVRSRDLFFAVSTAVFAGIHYNQGSAAVGVAALFGLAACWLFLHLRTLVPLILGHVGVNLAVLLIRI